MTFPSGRKVKILSIVDIETKDATGRLGNALYMRYETNLNITDPVALRKEIDEIWTWLKKDAEHRKLRKAIISAEESHRVSDKQPPNSTNFVFEKQSDGSWKYVTPEVR